MSSNKLYRVRRALYNGEHLVCIDEATGEGCTEQEAADSIDWPEVRGSFEADELTPEQYEEYYREQGEQAATDTSPIILD